MVKLIPWNLTRPRPASPDIGLGDHMASGEVAVSDDAGAGEAVDVFLRGAALLGIVGGDPDLPAAVNQQAQLGWIH